MAATLSASTVTKLLAQLPAPRRKEISRVRRLVRKHLPKGYQETVTNGMIVYQVPLRLYSDTYNGNPLMYAALASNKNSITLHLLPVYGSKLLENRFARWIQGGGEKTRHGEGVYSISDR